MIWNTNLPNIQLNHHLNRIRSIKNNQKTPTIQLNLNKKTIQLPNQTNTLDLHNKTKNDIQINTTHVTNKSLVTKPINFTQKNFIHLNNLHKLLILLLQPELLPNHTKFTLNNAQQTFLTNTLHQLPHKSKEPI